MRRPLEQQVIERFIACAKLGGEPYLPLAPFVCPTALRIRTILMPALQSAKRRPQHALGAMLANAASAPDRRHRPDAQNEQD